MLEKSNEPTTKGKVLAVCDPDSEPVHMGAFQFSDDHVISLIAIPLPLTQAHDSFAANGIPDGPCESGARKGYDRLVKYSIKALPPSPIIFQNSRHSFFQRPTSGHADPPAFLHSLRCPVSSHRSPFCRCGQRLIFRILYRHQLQREDLDIGCKLQPSKRCASQVLNRH